MFKLASVASFRRTVTVRVPRDDLADAWDAHDFVARFRALTDEEARQFDARRRALTPEQLADDPHALLREIVIGWDDVVDAAGAPVPFSADALSRLLAIPWVPPALLEAWRAGLAGEPRRGN